MYGGQVGGTLAAAVLGVGTAAATPAPKTARVAASHVGRQLAATGAGWTVEVAVIAVLLLIAGVLLVGVARRHMEPLD